jgi:hypothetical protein
MRFETELREINNNNLEARFWTNEVTNLIAVKVDRLESTEVTSLVEINAEV